MDNIDNSSKSYLEKYKCFFGLEKPYGCMIEELIHSLYEKSGQVHGNYLTALGLFCYSEVVGREIMRFKYPKKFEDPNRKECGVDSKKYFKLFLGEYMGYGKLLGEYGDNIYDWYRNGLCHRYKIKGRLNMEDGSESESGVFVYYDPPSVPAFEGVGVDTTKGILLSSMSQKRMFILLPYLEDFIHGIEKFLNEKRHRETNSK